jgi:DNA helicase-2/ATP-dependent DNA helicase PcrA
MSLFQNLNDQQRQAVEHVEGPMLVLAGAGSGKTKVVTCRIAKLIDLGVLPSDIVAVTFTNKAAEEMRYRIKKMKNVHVLTSTFHSLGAKILRESINALGYSNDFSIYDEEDSLKLLKNCFSSLQFKEEKGLLKGIKHRISSAKNDLIAPDKIPATRKGSKADILFPQIYPLYQARLKESNALDFDDLLYLTVKLLQESEFARKEYQNRWLFILIDEYQDTNYAQYTLTKILADKHSNIFAVGDPDQSIYSWRGARYQNILNFEKDFPGGKVITLEQNYRSTKTILDASNAVIDNNSERYEKRLWCDRDEGEKIKIFLAQNDRMETDFVIKQIEEICLNHQLSLNEVVIFYRTNAQSRPFEDALLSKGLPYKIIGGISFYQRREIKDILSILRMVTSNTDYISFSRSVSFLRIGIGQTTLAKLIHTAQENGVAILDLCQQIIDGKTSIIKLNVKQTEGLRRYLKIIHQVRKSTSLVYEQIKEVIDATHYLDLLKDDPESFEDRKSNLEELIAKAAEWQEENNGSLSLFLEEITLKADTSTSQENETIKLMTIHNGKGLEFELVFIVGLEEDLFPHVNSRDFPEDLEEERRLFYVAMTRAKKFLYLCGAYYRYLWGTAKFMQPSRFLKEIPSEYLENLSPVTFEAKRTFIEEETPKSGLRKGDRVLHKQFGSGTIQSTYETSYGPTYDVYFEATSSTRSLVAKYAKLEKIG